MEDERRRRMCTGKKRFKDEAAARAALHAIAPWGRPDGGSPELRTYRCDYCQRWHFTSQPPR
jgi:hypothetical protein